MPPDTAAIERTAAAAVAANTLLAVRAAADIVRKFISWSLFGAAFRGVGPFGRPSACLDAQKEAGA